LQTKFSKTACLAIIQLNILVKEQINITTPFYNENSKYSQSILANILSTKQGNFVKICDANFVATNVKQIQNKDEKQLP
jgi:hypothetical protein